MFFTFLVSFLSPALYAISGVMDAFMAKGQKGHPLAFAFYLFFFYFLSSLLIFFYGSPAFPDSRAWGLLFLIALIEVLYLIPYYKALKIADASVVAALFMLSRIFIPVLAYYLFNEQLYPVQYVGFFIVIFACVFLTVGYSLKRLFWNKQVFFLMTITSLILASQSFLYRYAFEYVTWDTAFFSVACVAFAISSLTILIPKIRRDIKLNFKYVKSIWIIIFLEELFSALGSATEVFALSKLPITIVKTVQSTYPFWVLLLALLLVEWKGGKVIREHVDAKIEVRKLMLMMLLMVGVFLVIFKEVS